MSDAPPAGALVWVIGIAAADAVGWPLLRSGAIVQLDLVAPSVVDVPDAVLGLGPELPRRAPFIVFLSALSPLVPFDVAVRLVIAGSVGAATAGAVRLSGPAALPCRLGGGLLYGLSPFLLTRLSVGHLGLAVATAMLPWALVPLLTPATRSRAAGRWLLGFGLTGIFGAVIALPVFAVGWAADRARPRRLGAVAIVAQLPWALPGLVSVLTGERRLSASGEFATSADGLLGILELAAGSGFWSIGAQIGWRNSFVLWGLGAVLVALAVHGAPVLDEGWRRRATVVAALGAVGALSSSVPLLSGVHEAATSHSAFAALRESQRLAPLFLVWLAAASSAGASRLAAGGIGAIRGSLVAVPAAVALALAAPGLDGLDDTLRPIRWPTGWESVRDRIASSPGPVVALPWHQYLDVEAIGGRRVYNPLPQFLGGDVLVSGDLAIGPPSDERSDPRQEWVRRALPRLRTGRPAGEELRASGARWVVLLHEADWETIRAALSSDPAIDRVASHPTIDLFAIEGWIGGARTASGRRVAVDDWSPAVATADTADAFTLDRPYADGWFRGWTAGSRTDEGLIHFPPGTGVVWFAPAAIVLAGYVIFALYVYRLYREESVNTTPKLGGSTAVTGIVGPHSPGG